MPPHFSLQPVLEYRHTRVEALEVELGQLLQMREQNRTNLQTLIGLHRDLIESLYPMQTGELDFSLLHQIRMNVKSVEGKIRQQQTVLRELDRLVTAKQSEVVKAKQDEEVLAILKNKEYERYQSELHRQEGRLQDDIYIAQAFRRSGSVNH